MTRPSTALSASVVQDRLAPLDGWRAISVALVIISHVVLYSGVRLPDGVPGARIYAPFLEGIGNLGVSIFFVISGFVICRGLLREADQFGRVSLSAFYVRRFFRIVPPLLLYVGAVCLLASMSAVETDPRIAVRALTFTCNFPGADCGGYLGAHIWSLSVEEQFYIVIPFIFMAAVPSRQMALAVLVPALVVAIGLSWNFDHVAAARFMTNFLPVAVGVACALSETRLRRSLTIVPGWAVYPIFPALIILERLSYSRLWIPVALLISLFIGLMLMSTTFASPRVAEFLSWGPLRAVGRVSYSIYLWQQLATYPVLRMGALYYGLSISACVVFAFVSYRWFERPLIGVGRKMSDRLIVPPLATATSIG